MTGRPAATVAGGRYYSHGCSTRFGPGSMRGTESEEAGPWRRGPCSELAAHARPFTSRRAAPVSRQNEVCKPIENVEITTGQ